LDNLLVKEVKKVFTMTILLSRNFRYGLWLWDKATPDQQLVILRVLKEALANPQYLFNNTTHNWVAALEKSFYKQQPLKATQASSAFFQTKDGRHDEDEGKKPLNSETLGKK
nr:hypothetical protein [Pseudomonadota bacterium]